MNNINSPVLENIPKAEQVSSSPTQHDGHRNPPLPPILENFSLGNGVATPAPSATKATSGSDVIPNANGVPSYASSISSPFNKMTLSEAAASKMPSGERSRLMNPDIPKSTLDIMNGFGNGDLKPNMNEMNDQKFNQFLGLTPDRLEKSQRGIHYNGERRVFRLRTKSCLYAFRVDDAKNLEHLYWGPDIPKIDDITYLTSTHVPAPFDPKGMENVGSKIGLNELSSPSDDEEAAVQWRQFKSLAESQKKKGRLENASWRLWQMNLLDKEDGEEENEENLSEDNVKKALGKKGMADDDDGKSSGIMETSIREVGSVGSELSERGSERGNERRSLMKKKKNPDGMTYNYSVPALTALDEQSPILRPPGSPSLDRTTTFSSFSANSLPELNEATNWGRLDPEVVGKNTKLLEFCDRGTGDYREPSFRVKYEDGSSLSPLVFMRHKIHKGKPHLPEPHMPHIYIDSPTECETLEVELVDKLTNLTVKLYYTVLHDYDVVIRRSVVLNETDTTLSLQNLMSCTVDFDAEYSFYMTQLSGGWARERQVVTRKLDEGLTSIRSSRGASSHQFNPFLIISPRAPPQEDHGEAFAIQLIYSGNFLASAELQESRRLRVNMGINPEEFEWTLHPRSAFSSPECVLSYSEHGIGPLSRDLHRLYRERLIPRKFRNRGHKPSLRPILMNTWECNYFQVSHESVVDIAEHAKQAGIEMIVLDDGWFGERNDTLSGLGDWFADKEKLPYGVEGLVKAVNDLGMRFGIWVEPEMISKNSQLYRDHAEWCLAAPHRPATKGRNQLALDFSRKDVRDYIVGALDSLLECANIEYVKWDMNRHLTEVFSQEFPAERQGEIAHRYIMGVYEVMYRITRAHPDVLLETCSGGGGRFDPGMLYFGPQIWASDNTDAVSRVAIQYGTSFAYPPCTMGSHVSAVPNHQTLRISTLKTRSLVAFCGTFGYELDPRKLNEKAMEEIREYNQIYKWIAPLVYDGDMYRLWNPFESDSGAWMFVSQDKRQAVVTAVNIRRDTGRLLPRLRLRGLNDEIIYEIQELAPGTLVRDAHTSAIHTESVQVYQLVGNPRVSGKTLSSAGVPVKFLYDADSVMFVLHDITGKRVQENCFEAEEPAVVI